MHIKGACGSPNNPAKNNIYLAGAEKRGGKTTR